MSLQSREYIALCCMQQWWHWLGIETKLARFSKVIWRRSKMIIPSLLLRLVITSWLARLFPAFSFIRRTDGTIRLSPQPDLHNQTGWWTGGKVGCSIYNFPWIDLIVQWNQITKEIFFVDFVGTQKFVIYSQYIFYSGTRSAHPNARPAERSSLSFDEL